MTAVTRGEATPPQEQPKGFDVVSQSLSEEQEALGSDSIPRNKHF